MEALHPLHPLPHARSAMAKAANGAPPMPLTNHNDGTGQAMQSGMHAIAPGQAQKRP